MNINDIVWVRLTPQGERVFDLHHSALVSEARQLRQKESGLWKFSLWELMHIFGPVIFNGSIVQPFVDNQVYLTKPE